MKTQTLEMIQKYSITTINNNQNIRVDNSIGRCPSDIEYVKIYKAEIISLILETKAAEKAALRENLHNSKLSLSYYFGDWYRANSIFDISTRKQPAWGNIENPFTSPILNETCGNYADDDFMVKYMSEYFDIDLGTNIQDVSEKYPDLEFEAQAYDNVRGKGEYISEIVFPSFSIFEKYLLLSLAGKIQKKNEEESRIAELAEKARTTGQKQLLCQYSTECDHSVLECSIDIVKVYIDENGKKIHDRIHTY